MRLFARIPTDVGPRTVVISGLNAIDAEALSKSLLRTGGETKVMEENVPIKIMIPFKMKLPPARSISEHGPPRNILN